MLPDRKKGWAGGPPFVLGASWNALFDTASIESLIAPALDAMGYRIVRVAFTGGRRPTLQVMAERRDDAAMTVDDCAQREPHDLGASSTSPIRSRPPTTSK